MASLARNRRWEVVPFDAGAAQLIEDSCGVSSLAARIMAGRGICDAQQARDFLSPSLDRDWADPLLIPGLDAVVARLQHALGAGEHIAVFGDFDVDGISATCLLTSVLREKYSFGVEKDGVYEVILNSDSEKFGGSGKGTKTRVSSKKKPMHGFENSITLDLPGLSCLYLIRKPKPQKKATEEKSAKKPKALIK